MASKLPPTGTQTRDLPALSLRAATVPASINEENRTVNLVWTTGAKVLRSGWGDSFYEELSLDPKHVRMGRLTSGTAPLLANHDARSIDATIGVVESATIGSARVRFAKDDPQADAVWNKVKQGILTNISVGYRTYKFEKVEGDDKTPTYRATDWEPSEISLVPMGADPAAGIRSEGQSTHPCVFVTPQESRKMADEKTPGTEVPSIDTEATRAAEIKTAGEVAVKAERERSAGIRAATRSMGADGAAFAEKMITDGTDLSQARELVLAKLAERSEATDVSPHAPATVTDDQADKFQRGAAAWLFQRGGDRAVLNAIDKKVKGFEKVETDPGEFRGMTLFELAQASLARRNVRTQGMSKIQIVDLAMTYRAGGYAPASDFAVLFENVMHKTLLGAYLTVQDTWPEFCKTETVPDFRLSNRYRVGSFGTMPIIKEGEEYTNAPLPDGQKTSIYTETHGRMIALSRQAIINDDMSANADLAARFGRGFRLSIEKDVYALLTANGGLGFLADGSTPFFDSTLNANVNGTGSALSVAGIDADRVLMAQQKDISSNEYLNLRPSVLLVPIGLGSAARIINSALYDFDGTKLMRPNPVQNLFNKVVDTPQLTGTRRYLFTDTQTAPAIVVAFLAGSGEAPFLEQQLGWRVDGMEWKARLDYKAQFFDPKGAVTNAGV